MKVKLVLNFSERLALALLMLFLSGTHLGAQELLVGSAKRILTPDPLLPVSGGVGAPQAAEVKKGDLFARALVFAKGDEKVAIVSVDYLGWPAALGDRSRELIKGIPPKNILIGATHTHSAPDAYAFPDEEGKHAANLEYLEWCAEQIALAVNEALSRLQPAYLKIAVGVAEGKDCL